MLGLGYFEFVVFFWCCFLVGILKYFFVILGLFFIIFGLIVVVVWIYRFLFCEIVFWIWGMELFIKFIMVLGYLDFVGIFLLCCICCFGLLFVGVILLFFKIVVFSFLCCIFCLLCFFLYLIMVLEVFWFIYGLFVGGFFKLFILFWVSWYIVWSCLFFMDCELFICVFVFVIVWWVLW